MVERPRHRRVLALVALGALALACRSAPSPTPPAAPLRRADELGARSPDTLAAPPSARTALGTLAPVSTLRSRAEEPRASTVRSRAEEPRTSTTAPAHASPAPTLDATAALAPLITVADDDASAPYALHDGALVVPGGLRIERVPRGIAVRARREHGSGDEVWEVVDPRGRRLALLKARSWSRTAAADDVLAASAPLRAVKLRARWLGQSVPVLVDRFQHGRHVYTIERRAQGTDWIWQGLALSGAE